MSEQFCPSCGAKFGAAFCGDCGQPAASADDFTLTRFFKSAWLEISNIDSRFLQTFLAVFIPGRLTHAYLNYQWQRYLPPFRLYLIVSGVYFFFAWDVYFSANIEILRNNSNVVLSDTLRAFYANPRSAERVSNWTAFFKFVGVLPFAAMLALVFFRRKMRYGKHFILAMHYYCVDFVFFTLLAPIVKWWPSASVQAVYNVAIFVGLALLMLWLVFTCRRIYATSWWASIAAALILAIGDIFVSVITGNIAVSAAITQWRIG